MLVEIFKNNQLWETVKNSSEYLG